MARLQPWLGLAGWLGICFLAAAIGSLFLPGPWFAQLQKPSWAPPNWIFAPVWSVLYAMMAVAAWLVWRRGGFTAQALPLTWFLLQLAFNACWSPLFFGLENPALALADIALLWIALFTALVFFWSADRVAGILLAPYLAWVTFATALNLAIWLMNR